MEKASRLFSEIQQQLDSKQLKPFVRTQYMRSAFQVRGAARARLLGGGGGEGAPCGAGAACAAMWLSLTILPHPVPRPLSPTSCFVSLPPTKHTIHAADGPRPHRVLHAGHQPGDDQGEPGGAPFLRHCGALVRPAGHLPPAVAVTRRAPSAPSSSPTDPCPPTLCALLCSPTWPLLHSHTTHTHPLPSHPPPTPPTQVSRPLAAHPPHRDHALPARGAGNQAGAARRRGGCCAALRCAALRLLCLLGCWACEGGWVLGALLGAGRASGCWRVCPEGGVGDGGLRELATLMHTPKDLLLLHAPQPRLALPPPPPRCAVSRCRPSGCAT